MKVSGMKLRQPTLLIFVISGLLLLAPSAFAQDDFKLKIGAKGELCLTCHEPFKEALKKAHLHPLLKNGECTGCHAPHTSDHKDLLTAGVTKLCVGCHTEVLPADPRSSHAVVVAGDCRQCHDSHGSDNPFILVKAGNELCLACHQDVGDTVQNAAFKHEPLGKEKGCLNCHTPHASAGQEKLLQAAPPTLCKTCHATDKPAFAKKHQNYPVADADCISCHDPHGSAKRGLLLAEAHTPVAENKCGECHADPVSAEPLATKKQGPDLCRQCHVDMVDKVFGHRRIHWPLTDQKGCLNCHGPHGGKRKKLLDGPVGDVCGKCHVDTLELQEWSRNNPDNKKLCQPVKTGNCVACHSPHAAESVLLMDPTEIIAQPCGQCHEWQTHSTHPIGSEIIDQRNPNVSLDCLSCHKSCGTGNNPFMLHNETTYELCVQCHTDRKRR